MSSTVTEADVGKRVESAAGDELGVLVSVEEETAYVDPEPDGPSSTAGGPDRRSAQTQPIPLESDAVSEITETVVTLHAGVSKPALDTAAADESRENGD